MTDKQFRSWLRIKLNAAAARPMRTKGKNDARFALTPKELVDNLIGILIEATNRRAESKL